MDKKKKLLIKEMNPAKMVLYLPFVILLVSYPLIGQERPKKQLREADYHLWGNLNLMDASADGQWISYKMGYGSGADTLFVKSTSGKACHAFPNSEYGVFSGSNWFAVPKKQGLELLDLKKGKRTLIPHGGPFAFSSRGHILAVLIKAPNAPPYLKLIGHQGKTLLEVPNVSEFKMSPDKKKLGYLTHDGKQSGLGIIELHAALKKRPVPMDGSRGYFHQLAWSKKGDALAFLRKDSENPEDRDNDLLYFNVPKGEWREFSPESAKSFPKNGYISYTTNHRLTISDDLKHIFLAIKNKPDGSKEADTLASAVQIWNGNDALTYKQRERSKNWYDTQVGVWNLATDRFITVSSDTLPCLMLSGDQKAVVSFDPRPKEVHYEFNGPVDLYITDLETERTRLFLKDQEHNMSYILPSPDGTYITYFRDGHWWAYNIRENTHKNLTQSIRYPFEIGQSDGAGDKGPFGIAGWTPGDTGIILYDRFDLWEIDPRTGAGKRLTDGREKRIQFRMVPDKKAVHVPNYNGFFAKTIDNQSPMLLRAQGENGSTGYYWKTKGSGIQRIYHAASQLDQAIPYDTGIVCQEQRFDLSPRIMHCPSRKDRPRPIYQSNPQQQDYYWGTARTIYYQNALRDTLKGVLFYPANYQSGKKYPMIVHIYERQFRNRHTYIPPSVHNQLGFNPTNFTAQGYFVLYPDITYELGKTGYSATDCVTAAVKEVMDMGLVKEDKIGLIGHSFGGYETDFIMTQTDLFATAVSGSAVTDLQSFYLTLNWTTGKPDMWRMENQQWRIGKSLFRDRSAYIVNSPLTYAQNIHAPILSWSGLKDHQVDYHQSMEWYLALRRLQKKHILLLYPEEPHWLTDPENQIDLTKRIEAWFSHFLKDAPAEPWIKKGLKSK